MLVMSNLYHLYVGYNPHDEEQRDSLELSLMGLIEFDGVGEKRFLSYIKWMLRYHRQTHPFDI